MSVDVLGKLSRLIFPAAYQEFRSWHKERLGTQAPLMPLIASRIKNLAGAQRTGDIVSAELKYPATLRIWSSDEYVFDQIFQDREYDFDAGSPTTIVDAGANIGLATALFATRYPDAKIIAIEPEPNNFRLLSRNIRHYENVQAINVALWHRSANVKLLDSGVDPWAYQFVESETSDGFPAISINDVCQQYDLETIDLLKIDIEGAEREIFRNGDDWIDRVKLVVVECHDRLLPGCVSAVQQLASRGGRPTSVVGENIILHPRDRAERG